MSHFNPNQHFDVESWRDQKIAQRTKEALEARLPDSHPFLYKGDVLSLIHI